MSARGIDHSALVRDRIEGNPDPRTHRRTHELAQHARARQEVADAINSLNNLPENDLTKVQERVEVIERVPNWQAVLINSRRFGRLVLPRYRRCFNLISYAYGVNSPEKHPRLYYVKKVTQGYLVPSPLEFVPSHSEEEDDFLDKPRGRYQDLVIAADGSGDSWLGALHAHINPHRAGAYEPAVAVGPDIDVLGLGEESDKALDYIASVDPGSILPRKIEYLRSVAYYLGAIGYAAEIGP